MQQNCVRDYVICNFTMITPGLHQDYTRFAQGLHTIIIIIPNSKIGCNILAFRVIIRLKVQLG